MNRLKETEIFIKLLPNYGLTTQQIRTLKGQAIKGDLEGARKGLETIRRRREARDDS